MTDEDWSHVEEPQVDTADQGFEKEVNDKLQKLADLEREISLIKVKLDSFPTRKARALMKISVQKWKLTTLHQDLAFYDKFYARKMRTFVGLCSEDIMKILFKLDQVESLGRNEIKEKRRGLVSRINRLILPQADKYLLEAQQVVTLFNKINRFCDAIKTRLDSGKVADEGRESLTEDERVAEPSRPIEEDSESDEDSSSSSEEEEQGNENENPDRMEEAAPKEEKKTIDAEPKYQIEQREDSVVVNLLLPSGEAAEDLKFKLQGYNDELMVVGKNFTLPFQVNSDRFVLEDSKVKILSNSQVQILIPRRRYSHYNPYGHFPTREYNYNRRPQTQRIPQRNQAFDPFFGRGFF